MVKLKVEKEDDESGHLLFVVSTNGDHTVEVEMNDGRIVDWAEYGQHIPLTCRKHPKLRWNTKNIAPIGCRTLFFTGEVKEDGTRDTWARECECSVLELVPIERKER